MPSRSEVVQKYLKEKYNINDKIPRRFGIDRAIYLLKKGVKVKPNLTNYYVYYKDGYKKVNIFDGEETDYLFSKEDIKDRSWGVYQ